MKQTAHRYGSDYSFFLSFTMLSCHADDLNSCRVSSKRVETLILYDSNQSLYGAIRKKKFMCYSKGMVWAVGSFKRSCGNGLG